VLFNNNEKGKEVFFKLLECQNDASTDQYLLLAVLCTDHKVNF